MQANTTTSYFSSNKFDLTEFTALLTLWMAFMLKGLTATLYSIADWLADQITIQFGIQGLTLTEPEPKIDPQPTVDLDPDLNWDFDVIFDRIAKIETGEIVIEVSDEPGCEVTMISPEPVTKISELTYKDLQRLLKEYRDQWGDVQCKLNAKREILEREAQRLGLIA